MNIYECADCGMKVESERAPKRCPYCKGHNVKEFHDDAYTGLSDNFSSVSVNAPNADNFSSVKDTDSTGTTACSDSKSGDAFGEIFNGSQSVETRTSLYKTNKRTSYKRNYSSTIVIGTILFLGLIALTIFYFYKMIPVYADLRDSMSGLRETENNPTTIFFKVVANLLISTPLTALVYTPILLLSILCIRLFAASSSSAETKGKKVFARTFLALSIIILVGSLLVTVGLSLSATF